MRALVIIASLALAGSAYAQNDEEGAKVYFNAGRQAYEAGRFGVAASAFEEAYRLSQKPTVLFSLAQAHRQQYLVDRSYAHLSRAIELFREYLRVVPKGGRHDHAKQHLDDLEPLLARATPDVSKGAQKQETEAKTQLMLTSRTPNVLAAFEGEELSELPQIRDVPPGKHKVHFEAEGHIAEDVEGVAVEGRLIVVDVTLREQPALIRVNAPDGASVILDGRLVGVAPLPTDLEVAAGRHLLVVTEDGSYGFSRELTLGRGEERIIDVKLETTTQRTISYYFLGTAGVLLTAGAVSGVIALRAQGKALDIEDQLTSRQGLSLQDVSEYRDSVDRRNAFAPVSGMLLGVGGAVLISGGLLWLIDSPRVEVDRGGLSGARASVAPIVGPDLAGLSFAGTF